MQIYMPAKQRKRFYSVHEMMFNIMIVLCVMIDAISFYISPFKYFDELLAILVIPLFLIVLSRKNYVYTFSKRQIFFFIILVLFMCTGLISTLTCRYQPVKTSLKDAYVLIKFFLAIGTGYLLFEDSDFDDLFEKVYPFVNLITLFLFGCCILDLIFHIFPGGTRLGLRAVTLFYSTYTTLAATGILVCAYYIKQYQYFKLKIVPWLFMVSFVTACTLRTKAVVMVVVIWFLFEIICRNRRKPGFIAWGIVAIGITASAARQFYYYFMVLQDESARSLLTRYSIKIAADYFPFGTGWGTYGSAFSVDPYSRVYHLYHLSNVWGLTPKYSAFVSDTFWPMVLAQHGWIGAILYGILIVLLLLWIFGWARQNAYSFCSGLICMIYLLISSTSESAFVNSFAVPFAFWLGILFADINSRKKEIKSNE